MTEPTEAWKQEERERCEDRFVLKNGTACYSQPAIVVYRAEQTQVVMDGTSKQARTLLAEIIAEKLPVTLTGQLREGLCSPAVIWATEP